MTKVAVFLNCKPYYGGAFQYQQSILMALLSFSKVEYEVEIIYTNSEWKKILIQLDLHGTYIKLNLFDKILKKIFEFSIDSIVIINLLKTINMRCHSLGRILKSGNLNICIFPEEGVYPSMFDIRSIGVVHDLMHRYEKQFPEVGNRLEYLRREYVFKKCCKYSSAILVDSKLGKKQVIESYKITSKKIHVLPFTALERKITLNYDIFKKYDLPRKYLFYPAQFWKHKNHDLLIKALFKINNKEDIHLILVGSPKNNYINIKNLINKLGLQKNIHILGYVSEDEKYALYKNAVALIMPTFFGPTNIPPLEAFMLGCPVAISNIYAIPEQVGNAALLFNPNNVDEIASAIQLLWNNNNLRQELIIKGYYMSKKWNHKKFSVRLQSIITKIPENLSTCPF